MRTSLFAPRWHLVSRVLLRVYRIQQEVGDARLFVLTVVLILGALALAGLAVGG